MEVLEAAVLRTRLDEVQHLLSSGKVDLQDPSIRRAAEPVPQYDQKGVRTNTRERLLLDSLAAERHQLVHLARLINPQFVPPSDFRSGPAQSLTVKIPIPFREYPDYNFIGLIIGPRGLTQKQMERDTGCKISIRGRGSSLQGQQSGPGSEEDLHVLLVAPDVESMRKAEGLVRRLCTPVEESMNPHKRAQLRKLAEINGTLIGHEESYGRGGGGGGGEGEGGENKGCRACGGPHVAYECPGPAARLGLPGDQQKPVRTVIHEAYLLFCAAVNEEAAPLDEDAHANAEAAMASFYDELGQ